MYHLPELLCKSIAKQDHEQNLQNAEIHNSTIHQKICKTQNIPSFSYQKITIEACILHQAILVKY